MTSDIYLYDTYPPPNSTAFSQVTFCASQGLLQRRPEKLKNLAAFDYSLGFFKKYTSFLRQTGANIHTYVCQFSGRWSLHFSNTTVKHPTAVSQKREGLLSSHSCSRNAHETQIKGQINLLHENQTISPSYAWTTSNKTVIYNRYPLHCILRETVSLPCVQTFAVCPRHMAYYSIPVVVVDRRCGMKPLEVRWSDQMKRATTLNSYIHISKRVFEIYIATKQTFINILKPQPLLQFRPIVFIDGCWRVLLRGRTRICKMGIQNFK